MQRSAGSFMRFAGSATISDWIGPTETTIYQIGCTLPAAAPSNYIAE